jgi:hypothetical protein
MCLLPCGFFLLNIIEDNEWFKEVPSDLAKGFVFVNWSFGE